MSRLVNELLTISKSKLIKPAVLSIINIIKNDLKAGATGNYYIVQSVINIENISTESLKFVSTYFKNQGFNVCQSRESLNVWINLEKFDSTRG